MEMLLLLFQEISERGEYLQTGLNTASILPFAAEFRPQLKNIKNL